MAPDAKLMQAFDFTEVDLIANRAGELSEPQKERTLILARGASVAIAVVGAFLGRLMIPGRFSTHVSPYFYIGLEVMGVLFVIAGIAYVLAPVLTKPWVLMRASGKVTFEIHAGSSYACVEDFLLPLRLDRKKLFLPDTDYDFYFLRWLGIIYSVEPTAKDL